MSSLRLVEPDQPLPDCLTGGGEAGARLRAHDWSTSPLGPPQSWPPSLRSMVGLVLRCPTPMYLAWGPELTYIYNDAYAWIIGTTHPEALARPLLEVWPEFALSIEPVLSGAAVSRENLPITLNRLGFEEEAYFTFSFTPVLDDGGAVAGFFAVVTETTEQVLKDRRLGFLIELGDALRGLSDPVEVAATAAALVGRHLQVSRAGYGRIDEAEEVVSVDRDWTNGTTFSLAGEARLLDAFGPAVIDELRAGRTLVVEDCLTDPRAGEAYAATWASIGTRSLVVVPLVKEDQLRAIFYLHEPQPRRWSEAEAVLARDVAERTSDAVERTRVEADLRESENRLRLAVDASRMAVWEHTTASDSITASAELNRLLGYPDDAPLDVTEVRTRYYPGDRERLAGAALATLQKGERFFEVEYRFIRPDGVVRWFLLRAEMLLAPSGMPERTVGVLLDITDRKQTETELREREEELRAALDAGSLAIFDFDHIKGRMNPSARLSELYGYPADHVLSLEDIRTRYHPDQAGEILDRARTELGDPSVRAFEWTLHLLMPDGSDKWVSGRGEYVRDEAGRVLRSRGVVMDITERRRWEQHQRLLINELNHRVKNTLATVQSIATQTLRNAQSPGQAREDLEERLFALSRAHDVLTRENWEGAGLREVVLQALAPYGHLADDRLRVVGPDVRLSPQRALALSMAVHELATNAAKYGALSKATGRIRITWAVEESATGARLQLKWQESGGPPVVPPKHRGFGSRLIERSLAQDLAGEAQISFLPAGVACTISTPSPSMEPRS